MLTGCPKYMVNANCATKDKYQKSELRICNPVQLLCKARDVAGSERAFVVLSIFAHCSAHVKIFLHLRKKQLAL